MWHHSFWLQTPWRDNQLRRTALVFRWFILSHTKSKDIKTVDSLLWIYLMTERWILVFQIWGKTNPQDKENPFTSSRFRRKELNQNKLILGHENHPQTSKSVLTGIDQAHLNSLLGLPLVAYCGHYFIFMLNTNGCENLISPFVNSAILPFVQNGLR